MPFLTLTPELCMVIEDDGDCLSEDTVDNDDDSEGDKPETSNQANSMLKFSKNID